MNHYDRLDRLGAERQDVKDAAQRLLSGTARASNGTPTVAALAREAGINRTSLYQRHPDLIAEFKAGTATAVTLQPRHSKPSSTPPAPGSPNSKRKTQGSASASAP